MEDLVVIKIGGNVIDDETSLSSFLDDLAKVAGRKILVHGGGKIATRLGEKLGIAPHYVNGRRVTDADTIDLVTMVYGGLVNKKIVAALQARACNAIGLTGADANIILAVKRPVREIDYGFVGDINAPEVNAIALRTLLEAGMVPVFAPLTHDGRGQVLNTNADTIASALAVALSPFFRVRLIYCFEKKGVLENVEDNNSVINLISSDIYRQLKAEKKLFDGMLPKIENAFSAIASGVKDVIIGDAKDLLKNTSAGAVGTLIVP